MDGGDRANQDTGEVGPRPEFSHGLTTVRIGKSSTARGACSSRTQSRTRHTLGAGPVSSAATVRAFSLSRSTTLSGATGSATQSHGFNVLPARQSVLHPSVASAISFTAAWSGRPGETPNTCYDASNTITAPIVQCVSAAPPTLAHQRFERYYERTCLAEAVSRAANQQALSTP
jgi:hypothetical protein